MDKSAFLNINGFREGNIKINRVGVRILDDGTRVFMPPEVLKQSASLFVNAPLKDTHKGENQGTIISADFDGTWTVGRLRLWDNYVDNGDREISPGMLVSYIDEPGVWVDKDGLIGEKAAEYAYDLTATSVTPNHVAIVEKGRNGETVRFELDHALMFKEKENKMPSRKTDNGEKEDVKIKPAPPVDEATTEKPPDKEEVKSKPAPPVDEATPETVEAKEKPNVNVTPTAPTQPPKEEKVDKSAALTSNPFDGLSMGQVVELLKKQLELDEAPKTSWDDAAIKKRMRAIQQAALSYVKIPESDFLLPQEEFNSNLLKQLGYEQDAALDATSVLAVMHKMKKEEKNESKDITYSTEQPTKNDKIIMMESGRRVIL